jgi:hypothetical protein
MSSPFDSRRLSAICRFGRAGQDDRQVRHVQSVQRAGTLASLDSLSGLGMVKKTSLDYKRPTVWILVSNEGVRGMGNLCVLWSGLPLGQAHPPSDLVR